MTIFNKIYRAYQSLSTGSANRAADVNSFSVPVPAPVPEIAESAFTGFPSGHFYSPEVDVDYLKSNKERVWDESRAVLGIDFNDESQINILKNAIQANIQNYDYPDSLSEGEEKIRFFHENDQFSWLDSRALFGMLLYFKPKRVIEIGSGYSSLLTADVNARFLSNSMEFTCIEPYPREFLKAGIDGLSNLIIEKVENVPIDVFSTLQENDILFVDSSHVSKTGSDVNFIFFEILPRLNPGVIIHFHDIFLPHEYMQSWVLEGYRSWNEQYLLRALLMYTNKFRVLFGSTYAYKHYPALVRDALSLPNGQAFGGCSFWIQTTS